MLIQKKVLAPFYKLDINDGTVLAVGYNNKIKTEKDWLSINQLKPRLRFDYYSIKDLPPVKHDGRIKLRDITDRPEYANMRVWVHNNAFARVAGYYLRGGVVRNDRCRICQMKVVKPDVSKSADSMGIAAYERDKYYVTDEVWYADLMGVLFGETKDHYIVDEVLLKADSAWCDSLLKGFFGAGSKNIIREPQELVDCLSFAIKRAGWKLSFIADDEPRKYKVKEIISKRMLKTMVQKPSQIAYKINITDIPDNVGINISGYQIK